MKKLTELIEAFREHNYYLSSDEYESFEDSLLKMIHLAKAENILLLLYDIKRDDYRILNGNKNIFFANDQVRLNHETLQRLVYPGDLKHSLDSKVMAYDFREKIDPSTFKDYILAFECRLQDLQGTYHRMLHKYLVLEQNKAGEACFLLLKLSHVAGKIVETPPRGAFIINIHTNKYKRTDREFGFTPREIEILILLSKGYETIDIAKIFSRSISTVNNHRCNILRKSQTVNTGQAVMYASDMGLI